MEELLKTLEELTKAEQAADKAEKAYMSDCENEELESNFDKAYEAEYNLYMEAANKVVEITAGQIDFDIAKKMVKTERNKIQELLRKTV